MTRHITLLITLIIAAALFGCQSDTSSTENPTEVAATPTPVAVRLVSATETPTATATPSPSPTPSPTPTPTNTPLPAARMEIAHLARHNGQYPQAQTEYAALLTDPGANDDDRRLALYWLGRSELALGNVVAAQTNFARFVETYPADDLTRPAQFNLALALERQGAYTDTLSAYQAAILPDDPIGVYIYERMGDLALANGDYTTAGTWYTAAIDATTDTGYLVHLREGLAQAYLGQEDTEKALAQYQSILDVAQIDAYRAKITRLIGEAQLQAEDTAIAQQIFQSVLDNYPQTYDAYLALVAMIEAGMPVDEFQRGYTDYYGGSAYQPAAEAMERYLAAGATQNADEARWIAGLSWRAAGDYEAAITQFDTLITEHPDSEFRADATLQKARTLGWQGEITQSITLYRDFAAANPAAPQSTDALWRAALIEYQADRFAAAAQNFIALAETYPAASTADDALHWAGLALYLNGDFAGAEKAWQSLLTNYPASEFARAASYWQAKTLLTQNDRVQAEPLLGQLAAQPFNFYGLRAADLLAGQHAAASTALNLSAPSPAEQTEAEAWLANWLGLSRTANLRQLDLQLQADPDFIRAEALFAVGLRAEALTEYETLRNTWADNPAAQYQLALHFQDRGAYRLSILAAQQLVQLSPATDPASVPIFIRRLIYPIYYQDLIVAQAEALDLDPALVFALIRQESLFEPDANSYADARGLMQIMPATGDDIANRTNTENYALQNLWLPYYNIEFGAWYIKQMLNFVDGNPFAALAAYNAGPGRVQEWITFTGADDLDIFTAVIPLTEPQEYIRRIYLNLAAYREIYSSGE